MTDSPNECAAPTEAERQRLRQLAHDLRSPLSVIAMGLDILKQVRHDDEQFARVLAMITGEGVEPLKTMIAELGSPLRPDRSSTN